MSADLRLVMWRRIPPATGHSTARLTQARQGWTARATEVLLDAAAPISCTFQVELDEAWRTVAAHVEAFSTGVATLDLRAEGDRWWQDGERAPILDGCVDVDIAATPLTNTFPIRRLQSLAAGESATTSVAWVEVPTLRVSRVEQTYTRLDPAGGPDAWEYSDPLHGAFRLTVDEDGLVLDYEGFATRAWDELRSGS